MESGEELSEFMHPEGGHAAVLDLQASPFEFRVLEVALDSVCSRLDVAVSALEKEGRPAVDALTQRVSSHSLETVKRVKGDINRLVGRVTSVRDEIQRFLDDDRFESTPVSTSPLSTGTLGGGQSQGPSALPAPRPQRHARYVPHTQSKVSGRGSSRVDAGSCCGDCSDSSHAPAWTRCIRAAVIANVR